MTRLQDRNRKRMQPPEADDGSNPARQHVAPSTSRCRDAASKCTAFPASTPSRPNSSFCTKDSAPSRTGKISLRVSLPRQDAPSPSIRATAPAIPICSPKLAPSPTCTMRRCARCPIFLTQLHIENPILVGHSDGASIALIHAGAHDHVRGLVLLAPHVFVEDLSISSIAEAKKIFETTNLPEKLARHHRDAGRTFWGWNNIWLHPDFRRWNIEEYLPRITCPILAIQGLDDQYGTMAQVHAIARQSAGPVEILPLADCRHSPQRDQPETVLAAIAKFVQQLVGNKSGASDV